MTEQVFKHQVIQALTAAIKESQRHPETRPSIDAYDCIEIVKAVAVHDEPDESDEPLMTEREGICVCGHPEKTHRDTNRGVTSCVATIMEYDGDPRNHNLAYTYPCDCRRLRTLKGAGE